MQVKKWLFHQELENTIFQTTARRMLSFTPPLTPTPESTLSPSTSSRSVGQLSSTTAGYAYTVYVVSLTGDLYSGHVGRVVCVCSASGGNEIL